MEPTDLFPATVVASAVAAAVFAVAGGCLTRVPAVAAVSVLLRAA